jgi:hypothetical protein
LIFFNDPKTPIFSAFFSRAIACVLLCEFYIHCLC